MLDLPAKDDGIAGAKLGIEDDNTTGKFLNQTFKLDVLQGDVDELIKGATEKVAAGNSLIIADLEPDALLKFANAFAGKPVLIFNVGSPDERLRRRRLPRQCPAYRAEPRDACRCARSIPRLEEVAELVSCLRPAA